MAEPSTDSYIRRVLLTVGIVALAIILLYFLRQIGSVLLLAFAAVLVALVIDGLTQLLCCYTPLRRNWAFLTVLLVLTLLLVGSGLLLGPQINSQLDGLSEQLPQAVGKVRSWLDQSRWGRTLTSWLNPRQEGGSVNSQMIGQVTGAFSTLFGAFGNLLIVLLMGVYIAFSPRLYIDSLVQLLPQHRRARVKDVAVAQGHALRLWLLARLVSMTFIGVFVAVGLRLIDVPVAISLGFIAALFTFIPYIGPFLGALPAILVALLKGPETAVYAALIYFTVESVESSLVTPIVERKVVRIPPAFGVLAQLAAGILFGALGIVLATPLAVVVTVAIQMLYLQDVLQDKVKVLGH